MIAQMISRREVFTVGELKATLNSLSDAMPLVLSGGEALSVKLMADTRNGAYALELEVDEILGDSIWIACEDQLPEPAIEVAAKHMATGAIGCSARFERGAHETWVGVDFPVSHWRALLQYEKEVGRVIYA